MKILYCTNEPNNPIDLIEISRLRECGDVTIVCPVGTAIDEENEKVLRVQADRFATKAVNIWLKFCTLVCRLPESRIAQRFPERNVYYKSRFLKFFTNTIWKFKKKKFINEILPRFSSIAYALPFSNKNGRQIQSDCNADVVIYNSLLIMSATFLPLLKQLHKRGVKRIANVRSWDNPYYVQFDTSADGYLVWSDFMAETMKKSQDMAVPLYYCWGPNILKKFNESPICREPLHPEPDDVFYIGYAAAFGDPIVTYAEYRFICELANKLNKDGLKCKILYRPYPTASAEKLLAVREQDNVIICGIDSLPIDRYGDGRETIRFGTPTERKMFLNSCKFFLSLGTTFTLEALIHGASIIHLFIPEELRRSEDEQLVFNRIEITCDHFFDYFENSIVFSESVAELSEILKMSINKNHEFNALRDRIGLAKLNESIHFQN